jgi:hypothetical protein
MEDVPSLLQPPHDPARNAGATDFFWAWGLSRCAVGLIQELVVSSAGLPLAVGVLGFLLLVLIVRCATTVIIVRVVTSRSDPKALPDGLRAARGVLRSAFSLRR